MKVISFNLNGIRSATRKGFLDWLYREDPDVICLQETKAQVEQMSDEMRLPKGYHAYFVSAEKKGYSGVGIYCKKEPNNIITESGWDWVDVEGRYLQIDYDDLSIISVYLPSGSSGEHRQEKKYDFMDRFMAHLKDLRGMDREFIICGDWNIAHKKMDIKNWRGNQKNSGFLPEEREWLDTLFDTVGYVDGFRVLNQEEDQFTWWSFRGRAYEKNVGWRIDYQIITPALADKVTSVSIYKDEKFSDHAPLIIEYDIA